MDSGGNLNNHSPLQLLQASRTALKGSGQQQGQAQKGAQSTWSRLGSYDPVIRVDFIPDRRKSGNGSLHVDCCSILKLRYRQHDDDVLQMDRVKFNGPALGYLLQPAACTWVSFPAAHATFPCAQTSQ